MMLKRLTTIIILFNDSQSMDSKECIVHGGSDEASIIVRFNKGQLGNQIFGYFFSLILLRHGYNVFILQENHQLLSSIFKGSSLSIHIAESHLCGFNSTLSWLKNQIANKRKKLIADFLSEKTGLRFSETKSVSSELLTSYGINLNELVHSEKYFKFSASITDFPPSGIPWSIYDSEFLHLITNKKHKRGKAYFESTSSLYQDEFQSILSRTNGIEDELERALIFKDEHMVSARSSLDRISQNYCGNVIWVGIHSRRTDHLKLQKEYGEKELTPKYYIRSMNLFRKRFKKKMVVFLYISDDLNWGRKHLSSEKDCYFVGKERDPGHDLALLSLCNHTILSYGTFSYWAGFLSGDGIKILPDHYEEFRNPQYTNERLFSKDPFEYPLPRLYPY